MTARLTFLVACVAIVPIVFATEPQATRLLRVESLDRLTPEATPGWLAPAIREALVHDLSRVRGVELGSEPNAWLVVRGSVQSVGGMVRVDLTLTDRGRTVGGARVTEPAERLFALQDAIGEQARQLVERAARRRDDDVAPDPREVTIRYVGPVSVPQSVVRPSFLPPSPASLEGARLQRNRIYELPTSWCGGAWWYARPGWHGWPGPGRWPW